MLAPTLFLLQLDRVDNLSKPLSNIGFQRRPAMVSEMIR